MTFKSVACFLVVAFVSGAGNAETILGIPFNQQLPAPLKECSLDQVGTVHLCALTKIGSKTGPSHVALNADRTKMPAWAEFSRISAVVYKNRTIEQITVTSDAPCDPHAIVQSVSLRFSKPVNSQPFSPKGGGWQALWESPTVQVRLTQMDRTTGCETTFSSPRAVERNTQQRTDQSNRAHRPSAP